jgi:hypothetical protein
MRSNAAIILGVPVASWAVFGCLSLLGVPFDRAGAIAVGWGIAWLALSHFGRPPRWSTRDGRSARRRSSRSIWNGAIAASLFLPIPVYGIALLLESLQLAPVTLTLPLFAVLGLPAPTALWWMTLWPAAVQDEHTVVPVGWHPADLSPIRVASPQGNAGLIPERPVRRSESA